MLLLFQIIFILLLISLNLFLNVIIHDYFFINCMFIFQAYFLLINRGCLYLKKLKSHYYMYIISISSKYVITLILNDVKVFL